MPHHHRRRSLSLSPSPRPKGKQVRWSSDSDDDSDDSSAVIVKKESKTVKKPSRHHHADLARHKQHDKNRHNDHHARKVHRGLLDRLDHLNRQDDSDGYPNVFIDAKEPSMRKVVKKVLNPIGDTADDAEETTPLYLEHTTPKLDAAVRLLAGADFHAAAHRLIYAIAYTPCANQGGDHNDGEELVGRLGRDTIKEPFYN